MDFRTNKPTKAQAKTPKTATPRSGWTIKSVGLAVGTVVVIFAILKSEPPSGSGDSDSIKTDSAATEKPTQHWQPEELVGSSPARGGVLPKIGTRCYESRRRVALPDLR